MKLVIALGGNALEDGKDPTPENQLKVVKQAVKTIVDLIQDGHQVLITHGNGPQVGRVLIQNEAGKHITPPLPLDMCGASTQGFIGYHIQQALEIELANRNINTSVACIITQVVVDKDDEGFKNPTKPVGPFYKESELENIKKQNPHSIYKEDAGRGYRKVVASPKPLEIKEIDAINLLYQNGMIVIAVGGGGIPVITKGKEIQGVDAVIDKDFASALIAEKINADMLIILTAVDTVYINFNTPKQKALSKISIMEAQQYIKEKQFAPGSMLPKVEAGIAFVSKGKNKKSLITSLEMIKEALNNKTGTVIEN